MAQEPEGDCPGRIGSKRLPWSSALRTRKMPKAGIDRLRPKKLQSPELRDSAPRPNKPRGDSETPAGRCSGPAGLILMQTETVLKYTYKYTCYNSCIVTVTLSGKENSDFSIKMLCHSQTDISFPGRMRSPDISILTCILRCYLV